MPSNYATRELPQFSAWLRGVADPVARAAILSRIDRAGNGNFGDHASLGSWVFELRVHVGPGYRIYYTIRGPGIILLLCGSDKSRQKKAIKQAKQLASRIQS